MALGRRERGIQQSLWIAAQDLPKSKAHPFYQKLNEIFDEEKFDDRLEELARPYSARKMGRPSLAPGIYFRMMLLGFFEGYRGDRSIDWHCADSLSHRAFLGIPLEKATPDHSTICTTRERLSEDFHKAAYTFVLEILAKRGLVKGDTIAIDASTMEANASLRNLVRRDTGETYFEYVARLAEEAGEPIKTHEELIRYDKKRKGKKLSNADWVNPHDPDAKVAKMKNGATDMAYKPEHAVDLETGAILAAEIHTAEKGDTTTGPETLDTASQELAKVADAVDSVEPTRAEVVEDKGYHSGEGLLEYEAMGYRSYVAEPKQGRRVWTDKDGCKSDDKAAEQSAVYANRRRIRGDRSKRLHKKRCELVERSFAHVLDTGGMRRTYLKGREKVQKRYLLHVAGFNLSLVMRQIMGSGKPREWANRCKALLSRLLRPLLSLGNLLARHGRFFTQRIPRSA